MNWPQGREHRVAIEAAVADPLPETELAFKSYRQATDKIVGLSDDAAAFLRSHI